jgi:hypothetical protein
MIKILMLQVPLWILIAWMAWHMRSLRRRGRRSPFNENILSIPGFTLRNKQRDLLFDSILYMAGVFVTPYICYAFITNNAAFNGVIIIVGVIVTATFLFKASSNFRKAIQHNLGVEAETAAGQELNLLMRDGAWVFHDIPYTYGNIDHVIVSTGGIFAIETKGISKPTDGSRSGSENATLSVVDGTMILPHARTKAPVEQAKCHANWLRQEVKRRFGLDVPVRPVVAVPGWMVKHSYDGECWVVNPKRGSALRSNIGQRNIDESSVTLIAAWIEDLSRSMEPKSKQFDAESA